jgi:AcrR family transcriptional regulator
MIAVFNDVRALNAAPVNEAYVAMFRRLRGLLIGPETRHWSRQELNGRAHLLMSEVFWTVAWIFQRDPDQYGRIADRFLSLTLTGLAAPGAQWEPAPMPPSVVEGQDAANEPFLRAATELINEEGYVGASVDKISARLKMTKGAFYHHHETKDELVIACFERTFQVMRAAIRRAEQAGGSGYQILTTAAAALVEYQMSGSAQLLRTSALTSAPEAIQPRLLGQFDRLTLQLAALISDGIADGSMRPVDANIAAQMLTGMINAAAELHFWAAGATGASAAQAYTRPFFEGLLNRPLA